MRKFLFYISIFITAYVISSEFSAIANPITHDAGMQFGFFYSALAHHGEWIEVESGTRVWRPSHIPNQWRPYLDGRWVWTDDYGWYWMSNEPFGWIAYHYGRWYFDDYYGWVWMPDDVWAPAWVEWRYDDDYIGWAPLPPYAKFNVTFGIRFTTHWVAPVHYWNFVRYNRFNSAIRYRDTAPEEYARRLIHTGRRGPQYGIDHERIINRGVDKTIVELRGNVRFTNTEVKEIREQSGERMRRLNNNQCIEIYRPSRNEMQRSTERIEVRRGERNLSIDISRVASSNAESRSPQEQQLQYNRKEMRRELIQRHERRQKLSPPAVRENHQQRPERGNKRSQIVQPKKPTQEKRLENRNDQRKGH